jgi:hypothetical protein
VKLRLEKPGLLRLVNGVVGQRHNVRSYCYTTEPEITKASTEHEAGFDDEVRVVYGEAVRKADGNYKEKGVDALLVADLIYYAAVKNIEFAQRRHRLCTRSLTGRRFWLSHGGGWGLRRCAQTPSRGHRPSHHPNARRSPSTTNSASSAIRVPPTKAPPLIGSPDFPALHPSGGRAPTPWPWLAVCA